MYPNLYYVFKDWFGVEWNILKIAATFGVFVAVGFVISAWVLTIELKRKYKLGLFQCTDKEITVGRPTSIESLLLNFVIGFGFGYKILAIIFTKTNLDNPQEYIFSSKGNLWVGLATGIVAAALHYYEVNKNKLETPQKRTIRLWPHDRVGDIIVYAFIFGFLGAKLFHNLENWSTFIKDPIGAIFSASGLTFYGGLICAGIAIYYYSKKHNINFTHLCDAFAPTMMIAYAIGRIGCQISGDGDWGIINSAFINANHAAPTTQQFNDFIVNNHQYYFRDGINNVAQIQHLSVAPVSWLPSWMFGYTYPNNVVNDGVHMLNCVGNDYCNALPLAVFPTPFYETIICFVLFFVLLFLRNRIKTAGVLFGIYLMMNGFERFWIEKIRVNTVYGNLPFKPTQAELIATILFITGLGLVIYRLKKKKQLNETLHT